VWRDGEIGNCWKDGLRREELRRAEKWWSQLKRGEARWGRSHKTELSRCEASLQFQFLQANLVFGSQSFLLETSAIRPSAGSTCIHLKWTSRTHPILTPPYRTPCNTCKNHNTVVACRRCQHKLNFRLANHF
jgi:hypothetical protein